MLTVTLLDSTVDHGDEKKCVRAVKLREDNAADGAAATRTAGG